MENATKALYIASGVLIGVMILSLGVMLFSSLQSYVAEYKSQIEFNELNSFNSKYQVYADDGKILTIQDVVTVAGMAYEDNSSFDVDPNNWGEISQNSLYIGVFLNGTRIDQTIKENLQILLKENAGKKYKCRAANLRYNRGWQNKSNIFFRRKINVANCRIKCYNEVIK